MLSSKRAVPSYKLSTTFQFCEYGDLSCYYTRVDLAVLMEILPVAVHMPWACMCNFFNCKLGVAMMKKEFHIL